MGHWYKKDGSPCHYVENKSKGGMRDTTLADAKKLKLAYSVSGVIDCENKPFLIDYSVGQVLDGVVAYLQEHGCPVYNKRDIEQFRKAMVAGSKQHAADARERGKELHDALEKYYRSGKIVEKERAFIIPVIEFLEEKFPYAEWKSETSFTHPLGYGGTVDLHCPASEIVLDFKWKDRAAFPDPKKLMNDGYHMQTAAYAMGLEMDREACSRYNLFGATRTPGLLYLAESTDFERDWGMFESLLEFLKLKTGYDPAEHWGGR